MSLSKKWFEQRDQFIAQQKELGSITLKESLEELGATLPYLFDLGILTQREFTSTTSNFTQLTALGGLFFVEQCQQIFISPENLNKLKGALEDWDNFAINYPLFQSNEVGKISIRNQTQIEFRVEAKRFRHRMKFRMEDTRSELAIFIDSEDSNQLLNVWNDFSQCVTLIENGDKSPTNIEIATDTNAIETLCFPWHPLVQRYFRSKMHGLGFERNLSVLKDEIDNTYAVPHSEWQPVTAYFDTVRPERRANQELQGQSSESEVEVELVNLKAINQFGIVDPQLIAPSLRNTRNAQRYCTVKPGDLLLYKNPADKKQVQVAYYRSECSQEYLCSELFTVLRAKEFSHWDGKRLFLFLTSLAGQTLLEYTFQDFSINGLAQMRLKPRQINQLEIPELEQKRASELDDKYLRLKDLIAQKLKIEDHIRTLMQEG
ncbi:hypothetical protein [Vibrio diabolicus]|uniref:hypothetical protein n=1 Tax=Vibrio diabolicus TaxID=50719 RepID=UPI002480F069|nr:hypothetical protein [Vibrio diabolicus]